MRPPERLEHRTGALPLRLLLDRLSASEASLWGLLWGRDPSRCGGRRDDAPVLSRSPRFASSSCPRTKPSMVSSFAVYERRRHQIAAGRCPGLHSLSSSWSVVSSTHIHHAGPSSSRLNGEIVLPRYALPDSVPYTVTPMGPSAAFTEDRHLCYPAVCVLSHGPMLDPSETTRKPSEAILAALAGNHPRFIAAR